MNRISRPDAEEWAAWFRALADPTRLQVLNAIAAYGPDLTIGELVARVEIGQSTVSHHVRLLAQTVSSCTSATGRPAACRSTRTACKLSRTLPARCSALLPT